MRSANLLRTAAAVLDIEEQRSAFEDALEKLSANDRLVMELLLSDNGAMQGLGLGRTNKLELLGKLAIFAAVHGVERRINGRWQPAIIREMESGR